MSIADQPAFPQPHKNPNLEIPGLTKREFMATQFMAASISNNKIWGVSITERAIEAIDAADKLLAELNKPTNDKP